MTEDCLELYAHLMTQHIGDNTEITADGVVRQMGDTEFRDVRLNPGWK